MTIEERIEDLYKGINTQIENNNELDQFEMGMLSALDFISGKEVNPYTEIDKL